MKVRFGFTCRGRADLQRLKAHGVGVARHGCGVSELAPPHLYAGTSLAGLLVTLEWQDLGEAEAGAEQRRQEGRWRRPDGQTESALASSSHQ